MTLLLIKHGNRNVLTSDWTAREADANETEVFYAWTRPDSGADRVTLKIPFNAFSKYVSNCEKRQDIADVTPGNWAKVIAEPDLKMGRRIAALTFRA